MTTKGNPNIKEAAKYDNKVRKQITERILKEYKAMKHKDPIGSQFAAHMLTVLSKAGYTAPDGSPLTLRGVRYQVLRSGIGFQGGRLTENRPAPYIVTTPVPAPVVVKPEAKEAVRQALSGVEALVNQILRDTTIPAERRIEAARALLQETTQ